MMMVVKVSSAVSDDGDEKGRQEKKMGWRWWLLIGKKIWTEDGFTTEKGRRK